MSDDDTGTGERRITLGKIVSYPVGLFLLLTGVSALVLGSFISGVLILIGGLLSLPIFRSKLKASQGISLSRWATVVIVLVLILAGGFTMGDMGTDTDQSMETTESTEEEEDAADTSDSSPDPETESDQSAGTDDTIDAPPEDLLPTIDDFDAGWTGGSDSENPNQAQFFNTDTETSVIYNVSVYDSVESANTELENRRPESFSTESVSVGDGGFLYKPGQNFVVINFQYENVVGKVQYNGGNVFLPQTNAVNQAERLQTSIEEESES